MKSIAVAGIALALGLWMHLAEAQNASAEQIVSRVLALEHAWNQAEERKDTKALDAIFDNDLIYVDYDGSLRNKAEFLARVKSNAWQPSDTITESMTGRAFGGTVIVSGVYVAKGSEKGKAYVRRGRFVDTWVMREGNWLCIASQSTPILR